MMLLPFGLSLHAQATSFTVNVSSDKITQHSVFEVRFDLQNADGSNFSPPSFEGFRVVGGPSTSSRVMSINGVVSQSLSWSYSLLATHQGSFSIGAATVVAGRKKYTTQPVKVQVVEPTKAIQEQSSARTREPVILKASLNGESFYPGQQIVLSYSILFRENVQTVSTLSEDDYADFFVQHFSDFSREATYETVNGLQFTSRIVKTMALFAHQSGTYSIDPMIMSVGINAPFPSSQGFFTMRRIHEVQVASSPLTIKILPLEPHAPESFTGAVGQYKIITIPGRTTMTTDEAFTFQLEVTGNGDSRRWDAPPLVTDGAFEIFDPKIIEDKVVNTGVEVTHIRLFEYNMIPAAVGDFKVYVPMTFFNPKTKLYERISSDTMFVHVAQGNGVSDTFKSRDVVNDHPPALQKVRFHWLKDDFWFSFPHLFLFALIFSGSCLGLFVAHKRRNEKKIPRAEKIRSESVRTAWTRLDELDAQRMSLPDKVCYEKATEIFYRFLSDRFTIPPVDLDESKLTDYLLPSDIDEGRAAGTKAFFSLCISVRYGAIPAGLTPEKMIQQCRDIIHQLDL